MGQSAFRPDSAAHRRAAGFGLIEALIALLLFAFILLGVGSLLITTIQSNAQARHMTDATNLAQQRLEALINTPYGGVASGAHSNNPVTETGTAGGIYTQAWTVASGSPVAGVKDVTVRVSWVDKDGTHAVDLRSIVSP